MSQYLIDTCHLWRKVITIVKNLAELINKLK